ncbi:Murein hydrolase activator NlpD precursor [Serratia entomophila]|jgi:lipoprotein NlpD|uniref:Murein hydrolase activator NlpD n=1 Tax=Serratia entomophila TaxID=42906 RepID=A0ABY5CVY1_9GAMM|nr:murein hydrolase activator NlpD [Serratia entomophila]UIW19071.1 murein hydrolase activator NlpD [Serratia entomophila]USV01730.1 murein hydrolase activator NlpD [Serratia entomophila]CAI0737915.1 Murein hydrolase activator NlpD precursor [Serratia entomophila]CAI0772065.1 Murein hydrolase activator NlpD precursor [Serratia entomophila]CAI0786481.1 Murein hydrolase activator NlpD precursor [Serratia entomophila]
MITLRRVAVCTMVSLWLAGCTNDASTSAPISSVGGGGSAASGNAGNAASQQASSPEGRIVYNRSYESIPKGSYSGNTYTVKRGDTLFYIAWITGNDFRDLAQRNNIPEPYSLNVGQSIQLGNGSANGNGGMLAATDATKGGVPKPPSSSQIQTATVDSPSTNAYSDNSGKQNVGKMLPAAGAVAVGTAAAPVTAPAAAPPASSTVSNSDPVSSWRWPTDGKIIDNFSSSEGGNKGVDIAGSRGQPIFATADGRVVYAGNALRGYGNLIIIKHNDDYLSAYAHNDTMLVREQQEVKAGQKIATMGSTGTSSVRLHFEIRYKGKSVNPLRYLPQR